MEYTASVEGPAPLPLYSWDGGPQVEMVEQQPLGNASQVDLYQVFYLLSLLSS